MNATKRSWLAALSIGILPWLGSAVSKHYEMVLNQTGSQSAIRMVPIGWLIVFLGGFFLAYFTVGSGSPKLPPILLVAASLLGVSSTWRLVVQRLLKNPDWLSGMPRSWLEFTILEPITVHLVLGFTIGWMWRTTR